MPQPPSAASVRMTQVRAACVASPDSVATTELLNHAAAVFRLWRGRLAELLEQGGLAKRDARRFATVLIASAEGAVVMSRAEQDIEPFETVARQLVDQARALAG